MALSPRELQVLALLRSRPLLNAAGLAEALGTTKGAMAVVLSSLTQKGEIIGRGYLLRNEPVAVVIGGAAWDIKARSQVATRLATSNPGTVARTPGGVGRNIAEGIARLGGQVHLLAAVGTDAEGRDLIAATAEAGVHTDRVITSNSPTGSYLAALDDHGELVIGISDFAATDGMQIPDLTRSQELILNAEVVVVDGNLPAEVVNWVLQITAGSAVKIILEPVSVAKALRVAGLLRPQNPVFTATPNLDELGALSGTEVSDDADSIFAAARLLHERGVEHVWVSRGAAGSLLCSRGASGPQHLPAIPTEVVDVTGAGDALTAGYVQGLLSGETPLEAARMGLQVASLTVSSPHTVRPDLGVALADLRRTEEMRTK